MNSKTITKSKTPTPRPKYRHIVALGSNLGDRESHFKRCFQALKGLPLKIVARSRSLRTEPLASPLYDTSDHQWYLNMIIEVLSDRDPQSLYDEVLRPIEDIIGHDRTKRWAPRKLDLDIILSAFNNGGNFASSSPLLWKAVSPGSVSVPHRGLHQRRFLINLLREDMGITYPESVDQTSI